MMRARAAAVAAALALAVSGCSTVVTGRPVAEAGDGAGAGAPRWVDVSGTQVPQRDSQGYQYGAAPYPGAVIRHPDPAMSSGYGWCTVGPAITGPAGAGFLTAGHCAEPVPEQELQADAAASRFVPLGTAEPAGGIWQSGYEMAVVPSSVPPAPEATRIAGQFPIAGVMTAEAVRGLPAGTVVCEDGAVDGIQCGALLAADPVLQFRRDTAPVAGDSGAAVFLVDEATRAAVLIGVHQGADQHDAQVALAAPLEPTLTSLDARVLLDPSVAPRTGSDYSTSVAAAQ